ncbi:MAG: hypothetical protein HZB27_08325 [Meiothermus silvanus]|nr:hypothetical protein [Allomeiothermus silvanus]
MRLAWLALALLYSAASAQLCDQPFSPTREGLEWQYRITGSESAGVYIQRKTNISNQGFVQVSKGEKLERIERYRCTPEGLVPVDFGGFEGFKVEVDKVTGVAIPDYTSWAVGNSWGYVVDLQGETTQGPKIWGKGTLEVRYRVSGKETVSVPAGRFDAFRVETTTTFKIDARFGILSFPFNQQFQSTSWYAEGVGLIKTVSSRQTTELVAFKR